ncbi:hypothetical protein Goklo_026495 [Gossypium klotzschianum]|uniref:RNase H type-1 domain-containing protein n=1 Tax=Gossypium klotzschianum TaxID=34286 RepID=A0A7J8TV35_9ROSI|nr:hypothetical protein [Gossypium klotzschianum]
MSLILDLAARISWARQFLFSHKGLASAGGVVQDNPRSGLLGLTMIWVIVQFFMLSYGAYGMLYFCYKKGGRDRALIQTNCLEVVKAIQEGYSVSSNSALLQRIQLMLQSKNHWVIRHVPRECNQVADLIAKMSYVGKEGMQVVEKCA